MVPKYPVLESEIAKRGIKKNAIARSLNITPRALSSKFSGKVSFTWNEVCIIRDTFFPDKSKDELFSVQESAS